MVGGLVTRPLSGVACKGLASSETCGQAGHYKYTAQSSHRHKTRTVTTIVAAHHPYIQTLHTHMGLVLHIGPLWKLASALAVDCHTSLCVHGHPERTLTHNIFIFISVMLWVHRCSSSYLEKSGNLMQTGEWPLGLVGGVPSTEAF